MGHKTINKGLVFLIISLLLLFLFGSVVLAQNNGKITAIVVRDNEHIDTKFIISLISSNIGDTFSKDKIQTDMKAIYDSGYFLDVQVKLEPFRDGYRVVFSVKENTLVKDIVIEGSTVLEAQEIKNAMVLDKGQVFSQMILQNDLDRISQLYREKGLILAQLEDIDYNQDTGVLLIKIVEGKIEEIKITGNEKTVDRVIRRHVKVEPGQLFDFNEVRKSLQDVYNLGFFDDVSMKLEPGSAENMIVLVIEVREKSTGLLGGGGGYSTGEGLFAYASVKEANLFGQGQSIEAKLEVGGRTTYSLSFYDPWLGNASSPTFFGLDVYDTFLEVNKQIDGIDSKYEMERMGGKLTFGQEFKEHFKVGIELKSEEASYELISGKLPDNLQAGLTNSLKPFLIYDTRDDRFNPTEGWFGTVSVLSAGGVLGGDYNFRKYDLDLRTYFSTGPIREGYKRDTTISSAINEGVLAMRMMVGYGDTSLPSFAKYEIGGLGTIRGYEYKEFVGDVSLVFNVEYRFPVADNLQAVLFADLGYAWDHGIPITIGDLKFGKGVGIRFDTFLGPISIDYGFGEGDEEGKAYFSIGHTF
ncbi:MAG: BamA/TamA family outer membrane protein [Candidatus Atribacteria bacterium]|nr:BamA/TamA family outer membrane protein [Candidatus Atribacteria bacterium]